MSAFGKEGGDRSAYCPACRTIFTFKVPVEPLDLHCDDYKSHGLRIRYKMITALNSKDAKRKQAESADTFVGRRVTA